MSGRGAGYCGGSLGAGYQNPGAGNENPRWGFGWWGRGRGGRGGRGYRYGFQATGLPGSMRWGAPAPVDPAVEKQALENEVSMLKGELDRVQQRLSELEQRPATQ